MKKQEKKRIVVALGGNALGENLDEQLEAVKDAAVAVVRLIEAGYEIAIVHGNGPQVGMIEAAFSAAARIDHQFPVLPMPVCVALSQGYIGYDLQNAIRQELDLRGMKQAACAIITQVEVDQNDTAFSEPTKPIGEFMSKQRAEALMRSGEAVAEDNGRGYRRIVASPKPINIIEKDAVLALLEAGHIPIAAGGGGIPVAVAGNRYHEMTAVIDKDLVAAKLAELIGADLLVILTAVEKIAINFGKPDERDLNRMTVEEAERYMKEGHFGKGSMFPKVEAAVEFVRSGENRKALITGLDKAIDGIEGRTGTVITFH
jgi:carbamate kinase